MTLVPVSRDFFKSLPFWNQLDKQEQQTVRQETVALAEAARQHVKSRMEIGQHLVALQAILEGKGVFVRYLEDYLKMSYRTGYRIMLGYRRTLKTLPEPVVEAAIRRGVDLIGYSTTRPFGAYTQTIEANPPPRDPEKAEEYLDKIVDLQLTAPSPQKQARKVRHVEPDRGLIQVYRECSAVYRRVGLANKKRSEWAVKLLSYLMHEFGLPAQKITPEAVPEGFRATLGRPKKG